MSKRPDNATGKLRARKAKRREEAIARQAAYNAAGRSTRGGEVSRYAVIDGLGGEWLEEYVGGCTCSSPDAALGHEPGCGWEGVARVEDLLKAELEADEWKRRTEEAEAKHLRDVLPTDTAHEVR